MVRGAHTSIRSPSLVCENVSQLFPRPAVEDGGYTALKGLGTCVLPSGMRIEEVCGDFR